jgi:hypothetical protein
VEHWRRQLAPVSGLRVGINWQGSNQHPWDRHRSVPLNCFEPLARIEGVRLICLQRGPGTEQLKSLGNAFPVLDLGELVDQPSGPFMDTAAILHHLDLVVTVDTALAHLAGGSGVPTWLVLHYTPDWRWLLNREDSPWYPTVRLFRQTRQGDWAGVFRQLAEALVPLAVRRAQTRPLLVEISPGELLDRLTILEIKSVRLTDLLKPGHIGAERAALAQARSSLREAPGLESLEAQLREVNEKLWEIEEAIRLCEQRQDFGPRFVELARAFYQTNDRRSGLKRAVNDLLPSRIVEDPSTPVLFASGRWQNEDK